MGVFDSKIGILIVEWGFLIVKWVLGVRRSKLGRFGGVLHSKCGKYIVNLGFLIVKWGFFKMGI
jgi:uncharacterized membrane protein YkgB